MKKNNMLFIIFLIFFLLFEIACSKKERFLFSTPPRGELVGKEIDNALALYGTPSFVFKGNRECLSGFDDFNIQKIMLTENPSLQSVEIYVWINQLSGTKQEERLYIIVDGSNNKIVDVDQIIPVGGVWR